MLCQLWQFVDVFAGVSAVGHAETKIEVKRFEELAPKVVSLYHVEALQRLVPYCEFNPVGHGQGRERR